MGLLLGLVYLKIREHGTIFYQLGFIFTLIVTSALNALNSIPQLMQERVIFLNEREEGLYSTSSYIITRLTISLLIAIIANTLFTILAYFIAFFEPEFFGYMWINIIIEFSVVDAMVGFLCSISTTPVMANSLGALVIGILTLFNGFTASTVSIPVFLSWICYLSPFYWSFYGAVLILYPDSKFNIIHLFL